MRAGLLLGSGRERVWARWGLGQNGSETLCTWVAVPATRDRQPKFRLHGPGGATTLATADGERARCPH